MNSICKGITVRIMITLVGLLISGFSVSSPSLAQLPDINEKKMIDQIVSYVELEIQRSKIVGLSLTIVHGDKTIHLQGFGKADDTGREVLSTTPFILGSTTKSFTAMAIMQLVEKGKIELDKPIQSYIAWFRIKDENDSSSITVRNLLNQTSGFSTATGRRYFTDGDTSAFALERGVRELKTAALVAPVGSRFMYSNTNYDILGLLVQIVSGVSYEEYIKRNIFDCLNMSNSYTDRETAIKSGLAVGYNYFMGKPYATPDVPYVRRQISDGYLISSAEDLGNYMIAQLNNGRYGDKKLLSDLSMAIYHEPNFNNYAMGWWNSEFNEKKFIDHSGRVANYKSNITLMPDEKWGVALLFNGQDSVFDGAARILPFNIKRILAGEDIIKSNGGAFETVFYVIIAILAFQLIGMVRTIFIILKWRKNPPKLKWMGYVRHLILPLILSVGLSISFLILLPRANQMPLSGTLLFAPDISWAALISGTIAIVWGTLRTASLTGILLKGQIN